MAHPVTWFMIQSGGDSAALQAFYTDVFAWKTSPAPDGSGMAMVAPEKGGIAGGIGKSMTGQPSVSVYIDCADINAQLAKIEAAGGKTVMPPMELPQGMGWIAGFLDPAGNWTGLWQAPKKTRAPRAAKKAAKKTAKKTAKKAAKKGAAKKTAKKAAKKTAKKAAKA